MRPPARLAAAGNTGRGCGISGPFSGFALLLRLSRLRLCSLQGLSRCQRLLISGGTGLRRSRRFLLGNPA